MTAGAEGGAPLRTDALVIERRDPGGRPCRLIDNTGAGLARADLDALLDELIAGGAFAPGLRSRAGESTVPLQQAQFAHVQIGGSLFRLVVERRSARLEPF